MGWTRLRTPMKVGLSDDISYIMDSPKKSALKDHHQDLRTGIIVANFLPEFRQMLTDVEYSRIEDTTGNVSAVDELVKILLTKTGREFVRFCEILRANGYEHWAKKLEGRAQKQRGACDIVCANPKLPITNESLVAVTHKRSEEQMWDQGKYCSTYAWFLSVALLVYSYLTHYILLTASYISIDSL